MHCQDVYKRQVFACCIFACFMSVNVSMLLLMFSKDVVRHIDIITISDCNVFNGVLFLMVFFITEGQR